MCEDSSFLRSISCSGGPFESLSQGQTVPVLVFFPVSFSKAAGYGILAMVMSKQTPIIFLSAAPEYISLSDDMTATAAHYSGQPFGLLKYVMLSVLPFKPGFMYDLSRPLKNNTEDHCKDMLGQNPLLLHLDNLS